MATSKILLGPIPHARYDWVSGANYGKEAIVFHKGSSYIALSDNPSAEPSFTYDPATGSYNVSAGWGLLAVGAEIVQETGDSQDKAMSQKAVTDALEGKQDTISDIDTIRSNAQKGNEASSTVANIMEAGYVFAGIATPTADPGTPDTKVFYIANGKGTYTNFGGIQVTEDEVVVLKYDTAWHKVATGIASQAKLSELLRDFGMYPNPTEYVLAVGVSGKYIDKDSALEVANGNYSISQPISLKAGDILLVPSASAVAAACSVVSKKVTNTYDKVIIYAYTYDEFGRINTATADYNPSLVYTAYYESDEQTTPTNWIRGGEHIAELPETHEVTESFYEPLVKQSVAGMPETGYYVYLASQAMDVVVSAYNATINGGHAIIAGWGIFKNVATNFVGIDKQRVIAEAIADLFAQVEGINEKLTNGLDSLSVKHLHIDRELSGLNIAGTFCLQGAGVPSASVVPVNWDFGRYGDWKGIPQFIGQEYFDTIDKVFYKAHGVTAVSDWKRITNA